MTSKAADGVQSGGSMESPPDAPNLNWTSHDPALERGEYGLTPLIQDRLGHKSQETGLTYAQLVTQTLLNRALEGHLGALEEILIRIDGDAKAKAKDASAKKATSTLEIDHAVAKRVLDAMHDRPAGPPGD